MDFLFDSTYNGLDLLVTLFGVIALFVGLLLLQRWHDSFYVAPERPRESSGGPRSPQIEMTLHGRSLVAEQAWEAARLDVPEGPRDDPYVRAFLDGTEMPPLPRDFIFEKTTPIMPRRNSMYLAGQSVLFGMMLAPGMQHAIVAASEDQARRVYEAAKAGFGPEPVFDPDWAKKSGVGFRILPPPPYDWQREDSGLA